MKTIQVRNVPDTVYGQLKARANAAGMSLSDYLLSEFKEIVEQPTLMEMQERLHQHTPVVTPVDTARMVREERSRR